MSRLIRGLVAYERDQLIRRYIALLDEIEQYHLDDSDRDAELEIVSEAANLMGATLGNIGDVPFEQPDDAPRAVMLAIMSWGSAFAQKADAHMWDEVISELMRMKFGDVPEMLKPGPRKKNQHRQAARLMFMKMTAIGWQEFFKANDPDDASDCQQKVADAYGIQFETLTKWRHQIKKYFGKDLVSGWLAYARSGPEEEFICDEYRNLLESEGRHYRDLRGAPQKYDE